jgi:L-threonylcarbamoyladenylate synthase|tara:strand:- start:28433 stop:29008 length:576 start_codon:yes stop_codon:yes gene_type:complete
MKLVKQIHWENETAVEMACFILKNGGVIVYPTDTLYGFGCDAKNESAIQKVNSIKNRSGPMSVLAPNKKTASLWMNLSENEKKICLDKLGGATTIIVPVKGTTALPMIMGENQTLGIRIPEHGFCKSISSVFQNPITSTSVNRTGEPATTNPREINLEFGTEIDLFIEDGIIDGKGSTIYIFNDRILEKVR